MERQSYRILSLWAFVKLADLAVRCMGICRLVKKADRHLIRGEVDEADRRA